MDLEVARKTLSKPRAVSTKQIAFLAVAGLCVAAGIALRAGLFSGQPTGEEKAPVAVEGSAPAETPTAVETTAPETPPVPQEVTAAPNTPAGPTGDTTDQTGATTPPTAPVEQAGDAAEQPAAKQAEPLELPGAGMILVSKRPVEVLASPSPTASAMYGFPAGRPFRVIGREGNFAQIQDLKSGASGWIDAAALAQPPRAPVVAKPSQPKGAAVTRKAATAPADPKPAAKPAKTAKKSGSASAAAEPPADPAAVETQKRPGLFGRGGPFGGLFGGGN
jgi:hypothetical protein